MKTKRLTKIASNRFQKIKKSLFCCTLFASAFTLLVSPASNTYAKDSFPIPSQEASLPIITAQPWLKLSDDTHFLLEGPAFDREGNLLVVEVIKGTLLKINLATKEVTTVYDSKGKALLAACDIHKDGRIFLSDLKQEKVIAIQPDGSGYEEIFTAYQGKNPGPIDDLVFDSHGNFYCTSMMGSSSSPTGRLYRVSADFKQVNIVLDNLAMPNGISIAPHDGKDYILWLSLLSGNQLLKAEMKEDGFTPVPWEQCNTVYNFNGGPGGPDSNTIDSEGNIYQAIYKQGRILIFDKNGYPTHNVLIPGRELENHLNTTNMVFKPETDEVYAVSSGKGGAWVYKFTGLAKGMIPFSHQ